MLTIYKRHISKFLIVAFLFITGSIFSQQIETPDNFQNPVLPGFHPDPSVCRVGDDYYLVNSSFEWYPGLPVFHSKDLVNWQLIGYGIHRPDQVELPKGLPDSRGVYAPSIRYKDGTFYIINTCVACKGNFYITATNPAGPWSDPIWLGSRGIDPEFFWDKDGQCYYVGHANISGVNDWPNKNGVWMQKMDLKQQKLVGPQKQLTHGHAKNARWTEGPHIYHIDGKYILLVAEGGTGFHHSITAHQSDSLWGPYIPTHSNPVLSHRQLGSEYPIHSVGHADLVQTPNGDWWSFLLAKRQVEGKVLLARETFLTPVIFEEQEGTPTPVFNPGNGKLLMEQKRPDLAWSPYPKTPNRDDFNQEQLNLHWNFLRTPHDKWYDLKKGTLSIDLRPEKIDSFVNPSLIARRIEHHQFSAATAMTFDSKNADEQAGLVIYRKSTNHFQLIKKNNEVILIKTDGKNKKTIDRKACPHDQVILKATADGLDVQFYFGPSESQLQKIGAVQNMAVISDENAGGFNGPYIGMYASSNGKESSNQAHFDWFEYIAE